ncbi:MAG: SDR family oxidoreductase [Pseudomonadota bacterium]
MDIDGKTVVITGASRGIGAAAARVFSAAGANLALIGRQSSTLNDVARDIGDNAEALACDMSDFEQVQSAAVRIRERFGPIDVLVGNAGVIAPITGLADADPGLWSSAIDINLKGVFYGMRAVVPGMISAGGGTVITVSSGAAHRPIQGWSAYCASKAGAAMLTSSLHLEHHKDGIRSLALSPGRVATSMQQEIFDAGLNTDHISTMSDNVPPEWPAKTLLWMCTSEADSYVGTEISLRDEAIRSKVGLP